MKMKVIFIVHYFPPLNSSGSRRVLSFAKYLSRFGHKITVLTTKKNIYDGDFSEYLPDYCEVIQVGSTSELTSKNIQKHFSNQKLRSALVSIRRYMTRVFGQLIDHRILFAFRIYFNRFPQNASAALTNADLLVSSSPPWPVHLAAYFLARRFNKPWIADYRDQFSGHYLFRSNFLVEAFEKKLDRLFINRAALVTVVSQPMMDYYSQFQQNISCIENGFDREAFNKYGAERNSANESFEPRKTLRYVGTITKSSIVEDRIPSLFSALSLLSTEARKFINVQFYGESGTLPAYIRKIYPNLIDSVEFYRLVPHEQALDLICSADALFFSGLSYEDSLSAKGVLTTKLFEYLASRRPIVADISEDSLAGQIVLKSGLALVCSTDSIKIAEALFKIIKGDIVVTPNEDFIDSFSREGQARRFETLMIQTMEKFYS